MTGRLEGRVALVTGGAGGIGGASVQALLDEGCRVVATGISDEEIAPWLDDERYQGVDWRVLDVGDLAAVDQLAKDISELDILVNCAGIVVRGDAAFEEDAFMRVVDINLTGTMRCCRAFLPHLQKRPGTIVNIASMMSFFGSGTSPGYAASKGGVAQLTKSLAITWAKYGIRVNAIAPGWIETPMVREAVMKNDMALYDRVAQRTPMGRWGEPHHIGRVVPLLCDDGAAWVTGVILPVDGGYSVV